jgi:hypothetical protein
MDTAGGHISSASVSNRYTTYPPSPVDGGGGREVDHYFTTYLGG